MEEEKVLKAIHQGELKIGESIMPCYVLENGERVFSTEATLNSFGFSRGRSAVSFFGRKSFYNTFPESIISQIEAPRKFLTEKNMRANVFKAELLVDICAHVTTKIDTKTLNVPEKKFAYQCQILLNAFAKTGVIALIDDVCGYTQFRETDALQKIFNRYLQTEARKWMRTFPPQFWEKLAKVKGMEKYLVNNCRPLFFGRYINSIIYDRLAPGITQKLQQLNPVRENGHRSRTHHQHLTEHEGLPELKEHLAKVMILMDISKDKEQFESFLNQTLPKLTVQGLKKMKKKP